MAGQDQAGEEEVLALSFNILFGGVEYGPQARVAEVIAASCATIVMIQEPHSRGWWDRPKEERDGGGNIDAIVAALGGSWRAWVGYPQGTAYATAFLSAWAFSVDEGTGTAVVTTPAGNELAVHNVHLAAGPYGPYTAARLLKAGEPTGAVVAEVTREAAELREKEVAGWRATLATQIAQGRHCLLSGDFNEPSHLDGSGDLPVAWPCSKAAEAVGLLDCYYAHCQRTGIVPRKSWTWDWSQYLAQTSASEREFIETHGEISDRIDYIYLASPPPEANPRSHIVLKECMLVCDSTECAEVGNSPWPSDHAAVLATFVISRSTGGGAAATAGL